MTELTTLSLREVAAKIKARDVSPVEVTQACLDRAAATEGRLNAFSRIMGETAMAEAKAAEAEIAAGNWRGELHGVPVGIKELYDVSGVPTTSSSKVRENWGASSDSASVAQLRRCRRRDPGQDPYPRIRLWHLDTDDAQPLGHQPDARRLFRRLRLVGCGGQRLHGHGL